MRLGRDAMRLPRVRFGLAPDAFFVRRAFQPFTIALSIRSIGHVPSVISLVSPASSLASLVATARSHYGALRWRLAISVTGGGSRPSLSALSLRRLNRWMAPISPQFPAPISSVRDHTIVIVFGAFDRFGVIQRSARRPLAQ